MFLILTQLRVLSQFTFHRLWNYLLSLVKTYSFRRLWVPIFLLNKCSSENCAVNNKEIPKWDGERNNETIRNDKSYQKWKQKMDQGWDVILLSWRLKEWLPLWRMTKLNFREQGRQRSIEEDLSFLLRLKMIALLKSLLALEKSCEIEFHILLTSRYLIHLRNSFT